MARDINKRLSQLRTRRSGTDRLLALDSSERINVLAKSLLTERWQRRVADKPYTRYAVGAMEEVDADYTRGSLKTAERVGNQLEDGLAAKGWRIEFRLQGSVPLNVHIRGVSDVDLLSLDTGFLSYATFGSRAAAGAYTSPTSRTCLEVLSELRRDCEAVLRQRFPVVTVDCSGAKAIKLSGGSLARPVDVVPSHWFDTIQYQQSGQERDRAVTILDRSVPRTIDNYPFLHMHNVNMHDALAAGGLKKAIRLCKNVKSDAEGDGKSIELPSFDIAATMYHSDLNILRTNTFYELSVLAETQRFLDWLATNEAQAKRLMVPDGSRVIFDSDAKLRGLLTLSIEMDDLAREVAIEQNPLLVFASGPISLQTARDTISSVIVPAAA